jgi:hypothetical protein
MSNSTRAKITLATLIFCKITRLFVFVVLNNCRRYCWLAVLIVLFSSCKKGNSFDNSGQEAAANQAADFDINQLLIK